MAQPLYFFQLTAFHSRISVLFIHIYRFDVCSVNIVAEAYTHNIHISSLYLSSSLLYFDMPEIKTFIFFDTETTGLPVFEYNRTQITEMAFVACSSEHLLDTSMNNLPRVLQKLVVVVNPMRMIQPKSTELTGK